MNEVKKDNKGPLLPVYIFLLVNSELTDKTILVPLTNSLYVPGKLADTEHVIVDIGTGYYVKKVILVICILIIS